MDFSIFIQSLTPDEIKELKTFLENYGRTGLTVDQWLQTFDRDEISTRLYNLLFYRIKRTVQFINQITWDHFKYERNIGLKTWAEFIKLRGY